MTTRPHFRADTNASATFDRHRASNLASAVRAVIHMGFSVTTDDFSTPALDALEAMPKEARGDYALRAAGEIAIERQALALVANQANVHRAMEASKADARAAERTAFVTARAMEIEAKYHADLRASFLAQAEREASAHFGDAAPITPGPKPRGKRAA